MVSTRKVCPSDRALKQNIPHLGEARLAMEEDHVPRRMPRTMIDFELGLTQGHDVAVLKPAIGDEGARISHAPFRTRRFDLIDPECVVAVRPFDRNAGQGLQSRGSAGMVQMSMGDPDLLKR